MPVIVRVAAELLRPWQQAPEFRAWETPGGSIPWLEALVEAERKAQGHQGQGLSVAVIWRAFNQAMASKDEKFKPVSDQACYDQMETLMEYGFVSKIGARWASTPAGREALAIMGQRGSLWSALNKLLESGKVSKEDVIQAMVPGHKKGSEKELLGLVEPGA